MKEKLDEILKEYERLQRNRSSLRKCIEDIDKVLYDEHIYSDADRITRITELVQDFEAPF